MSLEELDQDPAPDLRALQVTVGTGDPVIGHLGRNAVAVWRDPSFVDSLIVGDVVELRRDTVGDSWVATAKLGNRKVDVFAAAGYWGMPMDFGQGDSAAGQQPFQSYASTLAHPPSAVQCDDQDNSRLSFGVLGNQEFRARAYYGYSTAWLVDIYTGEDPPYRHMSFLPTSALPAQVELTLMDGHYPGDVLTPVASPIAVDLVYRGDVLTVVELPGAWQDALAAGEAGAIEFAPADTTQGLTTIAIGELGSLAIHH